MCQWNIIFFCFRNYKIIILLSRITNYGGTINISHCTLSYVLFGEILKCKSKSAKSNPEQEVSPETEIINGHIKFAIGDTFVCMVYSFLFGKIKQNPCLVYK